MATLRAGILLDNARLQDLLAFLLASSIVSKLAALDEMKQKCMAMKWHWLAVEDDTMASALHHLQKTLFLCWHLAAICLRNVRNNAEPLNNEVMSSSLHGFFFVEASFSFWSPSTSTKVKVVSDIDLGRVGSCTWRNLWQHLDFTNVAHSPFWMTCCQKLYWTSPPSPLQSGANAK